MLGVGLAIGRMLFACLSCFLGLVILVTVGMFLTGHWITASLLFIGGNWLHSWLWALLTEENSWSPRSSVP
jgi:hypothetical protein